MSARDDYPVAAQTSRYIGAYDEIQIMLDEIDRLRTMLWEPADKPLADQMRIAREMMMGLRTP